MDCFGLGSNTRLVGNEVNTWLDIKKTQIESKFEYGASFVNIHGIGDHNVSTVKEAVEAVRITYGEENILISIDEEKKLIIKARIELRRKLSQGLT